MKKIFLVSFLLVLCASLLCSCGGESQSFAQSENESGSAGSQENATDGKNVENKEDDSEISMDRVMEIFGDPTATDVKDSVSGHGDDVTDAVSLGGGLYRMHFSYRGDSSVTVYAYDEYGEDDYLFSGRKNYDGYVLLKGNQTVYFEISSDGDWNYSIEKLSLSDAPELSGRGDYVTNIFKAESGTWEFTCDGDSGFSFEMYTSDGDDYIVGDSAPYTGKKVLSIPKDGYVVLVVEAEGNWTATPVA